MYNYKKKQNGGFTYIKIIVTKMANQQFTKEKRQKV